MTSLRPLVASGYTVILPPGWLRLDARSEDGAEGLDRELDSLVPPRDSLPRDSFGPLIAEARKMAHSVLEQARVAGALDLYLPLGGMHGITVPASFLVSLYTFPEPPPHVTASQDAEATAVLMATMMAARMPQGEVRTMPAGIAVRSRRVIPAAGASKWPGTQVDYQWPMPSEPLKWAIATFTTAGGGKPEDDITELLVQLFDAIMLTWRWRPGLII